MVERTHGVDDRIRNLHHAATDIVGATDVEAAYEQAVETAETVLAFDVCVIYVADCDTLELIATSDPAATTQDSHGVDEGVTGKTYREGTSVLVEDAARNPVADPANEEYASAVSVPVGDDAVFQAISTVEGYYDRHDLEVAKLLAVHVEEAVERIRSERALRQSKQSIERLHSVATDLESCLTREAAFESMVEAAEEILGFDWSGVIVPRDGWFVVVATTRELPVEVGSEVFPVDEGMAGEVYRTGDSQLVTDVDDNDRASPTRDAIRSGLGVAIGDVGVFQATSSDRNAFDETDVELTELLAANVAEACERIDVQNQLEQRRRELQRLVENLPGMVYRTAGGPGTGLAFASDGTVDLTGYDPGSLTAGDPGYGELVHPDDCDGVDRERRLAVDAGRPYEVSYRLRTADGDWRWVQEQGSGVYDDDGNVLFVEGFVSDVTESKRREQLRVLNRVLRHNVRNQVTVLEGHAEHLADRVEDPTLAESTDAIGEAAGRIVRISEKARIVQELLDHGPESERTRLDPDVLVARAVADAREEFPDATIECAIEEPPAVYAVDDLPLAIEELVENAVVHADSPSPMVRVAVTGTDGGARFTVRDDGPGIPRDERRAIRSKAESPLEHGSGLGLWIVNWIVDDSDGDLRIDDTGDGTVVTVTVPSPPGEH